MTSELSSASLSWQRLQLVLCHINNFYGKVSGVDGQLLVWNIIDTVRFRGKLWDIIGVSGFFWDTVYIVAPPGLKLSLRQNCKALYRVGPSISTVYVDKTAVEAAKRTSCTCMGICSKAQLPLGPSRHSTSRHARHVCITCTRQCSQHKRKCGAHSVTSL